tara:strand:- start:8631 stop:8954 length:324 start_codon:yes stop_codon:yes gene_type:complete
MSFFDDIDAGINEAVTTMGESFTMGNHVGGFMGVFRGETSPTEFDKIQGYDTKTTDALTVNKVLFTPGAPPMVNEEIIKANGDVFIITMVENGDTSSWDIELSKRDE